MAPTGAYATILSKTIDHPLLALWAHYLAKDISWTNPIINLFASFDTADNNPTCNDPVILLSHFLFLTAEIGHDGIKTALIELLKQLQEKGIPFSGPDYMFKGHPELVKWMQCHADSIEAN